MDKRDTPRVKSRLKVRFWKPKGKKAIPAFTKDVSQGGVYIQTNSPCRPGERIKIELQGASGRQVEFYGVVTHATRVPLALRGVADSGMGVRFLHIDELMNELVGVNVGRSKGSATTRLPATSGWQASSAQETDDGGYRVEYKTIKEFLAALAGDLQHGGLFLATPNPLQLDDEIVAEFVVTPVAHEPVKIPARVVQTFDQSADTAGASTRPPGVGIAFNDPLAGLEQLEVLGDTLRSRSGGA